MASNFYPSVQICKSMPRIFFREYNFKRELILSFIILLAIPNVKFVQGSRGPKKSGKYVYMFAMKLILEKY